MAWTVYIMVTQKGSYYTGVTTDLSRRWRAHAEGRGSRAMRMAGGPRELAWTHTGLNKHEAHRLENTIKRLPRSQKATLITHGLEAVGLDASATNEGPDPSEPAGSEDPSPSL